MASFFKPKIKGLKNKSSKKKCIKHDLLKMTHNFQNKYGKVKINRYGILDRVIKE